MDQIAVISDVHGNLTALETVLADIEARKLKTIFNLGDLAGKGPSPAEVVDLCRARCGATVLGNWDDILVRKDDGEVLRWNQARLGAERLAYLAGLPHTIDFQMSGRRIRLYHASHISVHHRIYPFDTLEKLEGMFVNTDFTGYAHPEPDVVGYGDIHAAYLMPIYRTKQTLFNTGSVGNPLDETTACYAILRGVMDGKRSDPFQINFVRVPYDIEKAIAEARAVDMPELEPYEMELRTGIYRGRPE